jgi:hypothetical protein
MIVAVKFNVETLYKEFINKKIAAHVLWIDIVTGAAEVVDSFIEGDVISAGFEMLQYRAESLAINSKLSFEDFRAYRETEPGCNLAIFGLELSSGHYQLNFVELN